MSWRMTTLNHAIAPGQVEARGLIQSLSKAQSALDAAKIQIWAGLTKLQLGDLAIVSETDGPSDHIELEGDFSRWNGLGFGMEHGNLIVRGDTGARTGGELSGGCIEIHGHCGPWAGVSARGGRMKIHENTGDWLGANWPGEPKGMTGGEIIVKGQAGQHAGSRMRRGVIAIGGNAGAGLALSMIAGSILVAGSTEGAVGSGMKRGTILLKASGKLDQNLSSGFKSSGEFRPLTLNMQLRYLQAIGWHKSDELLNLNQCERFSGDLLALGLGEVLVLH